MTYNVNVGIFYKSGVEYKEKLIKSILLNFIVSQKSNRNNH